jgi:hypothetical protein
MPRTGSRPRSVAAPGSRHCSGEALSLDGAKVVEFEEVAKEAPCIRVDQQRTGLSQAL